VVSPECRSQLYKQLTATARDYRADPSLREACAADAAAHCKDVKPGGGRVQACLVSGPPRSRAQQRQQQQQQ
jgi:hypothetical protein